MTSLLCLVTQTLLRIYHSFLVLLGGFVSPTQSMATDAVSVEPESNVYLFAMMQSHQVAVGQTGLSH